ncbi:MAG: cell division ATP-binding protein FtsE [Patescibacteria group bacterium]|nr:cell division ATP-binding protein FtsE [Patescibacteria group bacterium]
MITLKNITKFYPPDTYALNNVNLCIKPGEFVSVIGRSGAGKSTIIKLLIAEEKPDQGQISIGGWDITKIKHNDVPLLRRQLGVVFQDIKLLPKKTVFENVAFALEVSGANDNEIKQVVPELLKIVGLESKTKRFPYQLSGGEAQRAAIARALVHQPKILIADEPTGNLDGINTKEIVDLLEKINELGTTVVLVSHDSEIVNYLKKRVITLKNGIIIADQEKGCYSI